MNGMKTYLATKTINATPMTSHSFQQNVKSQKIVSGDDVEGYLVIYLPDNYKSWLPKEVFEAAYRKIFDKE